MPAQIDKVVQHIRRVVLGQEQGGLTDGQLLSHFIEHRDEAAVTALVRRHGGMVWGVCRRVLHNHHDAEDAFQATFMVLVRKAKSIRQRELVGNWLYGVAQQTAMKARSVAEKHRTRERQVIDMPEPPGRDTRRDLQAVLDLELSRLPDKYRAAIVLCELQGKTRKEAARQLGVPEGTVAGRLTRGRAILAKRLARRGVTVSAAALAAVLGDHAAAAYVPPSVMSSTIKAVTLSAAGQTAVGMCSVNVAALTEGVLKAMFMSKLKIATGVALVAGTVILGSMFSYGTRAADDRAPAPTPQSKDRLADTLILLDKQLWEATSKYDVDTLGKILADDWVGADWNKAYSLEHYSHARYVEVKFLSERRVVRIDEHCAIMSYEVKWRAEDKAKGQPPSSHGHDRCIHCWVQRDGGWFIKYSECVSLLKSNDEPTQTPAAPKFVPPLQPADPFPTEPPRPNVPRNPEVPTDPFVPRPGQPTVPTPLPNPTPAPEPERPSVPPSILVPVQPPHPAPPPPVSPAPNVPPIVPAPNPPGSPLEPITPPPATPGVPPPTQPPVPIEPGGPAPQPSFVPIPTESLPPGIPTAPFYVPPSDPQVHFVTPEEAAKLFEPQITRIAPPNNATAWSNGARASSAWDDHTPEVAFDGDGNNMWNSGGYAPAWIEKDLGSVTLLSGIVLHVSQTPEGATTHEVWLSDEPIGNDHSKATLVHTFKGVTKDGQVLSLDFAKNTKARYMQLRTTESPSWIGWRQVEIR
jgi:RNA polymerase sigma factor (sigma-70 family)